MSESMPERVPREGGHIPELDGVRGAAITLVIGFHLVQAMPCINRELPRGLVVLSRLGQTGVDLFFVLSGFLITGILLRQRGRPKALMNFWGRRFLRIFPLYYAVLLLVIAIPQLRTLPLATSAADWWLWTYLANIPPTIWGTETSLPHFWSLAVEEQFYLVWPLVVLWMSPRSVGRISLTLMVLAPLVRWGCTILGWSTFYALPCRMDALAAGAWLATVVHLGVVQTRDLRGIRWGMIAVCGLAAGWFVVASGRGAASSQIIKHTLCSLIYVWLLAEAVLSHGTGWLNAVLCWSWLRTLGKYSYGLYVLHPLLMALINHSIPVGTRGPLTALLAAVGVLVGSGVAAKLTWMLIEAPCLRLKEHFSYGTPSAGGTSTLNTEVSAS